MNWYKYIYSSLMNYSGIINPNTTGLPYYDELLRNPEAYKEEGIYSEVVLIPPLEYEQMMANFLWGDKENKRKFKFFDKLLEEVHNRVNKQKIENFSKSKKLELPMPVIDFKNDGSIFQEGHHRIRAAELAGEREIPVLIVNEHHLLKVDKSGYSSENEMYDDFRKKIDDKSIFEVLDILKFNRNYIFDILLEIDKENIQHEIKQDEYERIMNGISININDLNLSKFVKNLYKNIENKNYEDVIDEEEGWYSFANFIADKYCENSNNLKKYFIDYYQNDLVDKNGNVNLKFENFIIRNKWTKINKIFDFIAKIVKENKLNIENLL